MASVGNTQTRRSRPRPAGKALRAGLPRQASSPQPKRRIDYATLVGVAGSFTMIGLAMVLGGRATSFVNLPGLLIVLGGTFLVTTISFTLAEVLRAQRVMLRAVAYHAEKPSQAALLVIELAELARRKGSLMLQGRTTEQTHNRILHRALNMVIDGLPADEVERILISEAKETTQRHQRSASVLRRAGEVAPAMGLIGTLVGLVQMLGSLDDPTTIGPAMAVALLTTFYGAVLANMVFNPLASKLDRNSQAEGMINQIYAIGVMSISRQENPRRLETILNTILPPAERVRHFD